MSLCIVVWDIAKSGITSNVCECVTYLRAGIFTNHVQNVNIISHAADIRCLVVVVVVCDFASA